MHGRACLLSRGSRNRPGSIGRPLTVRDLVGAPDELPLGRLEALSDGVFAIAITLLVLELALAPGAVQDPLRAILDELPSYLAYVTSFLTIGVVWMAHATITSALRAADAALYRLNLLVLLLVAFLPFPTKLVGDFVAAEEAERVAVVFYGLTLLALAVALTFLLRYAFGRCSRSTWTGRPPPPPPHVATGLRTSSTPARSRSASCCPVVAVGLYLGIALYLRVPVRTIGQMARRV